MIGKQTSISQMIENSRHRIILKNLCSPNGECQESGRIPSIPRLTSNKFYPTPGVFSHKHTPRYNKIIDQLSHQEDHDITDRIKNWKHNVFDQLSKKRAVSVPKYSNCLEKPKDDLTQSEQINVQPPGAHVTSQPELDTESVDANLESKNAQSAIDIQNHNQSSFKQTEQAHSKSESQHVILRLYSFRII